MSDQGHRDTGWSFRGPELVGLVLIVLGLAWLLGATSLIRIDWGLVWPILVIALGAAVLLSALRPRSGATGRFVAPRDGTDQLELDLGLGAGHFALAGGADQLVNVQSRHDDIQARVDRSGRRARIRLRQDVDWLPLSRGGADWQIRVASDVATALSVQGGAGNFDLDLSAVRIVDARLTFGAAEARVTLPRPTGDVAVKVTGGAASITIQVPPGVEASIRDRRGLMSVSGQTETPGYGTARDRVTVTVTGGASQVRVI